VGERLKLVESFDELRAGSLVVLSPCLGAAVAQGF
jgi:hypothetical protein